MYPIQHYMKRGLMLKKKTTLTTLVSLLLLSDSAIAVNSNTHLGTLSCNFDCNSISVEALLDGKAHAFILDKSNKWTKILADGNRNFMFISHLEGQEFIAAIDNKIVRINTAKDTYKVIYTNKNKVFYPTLKGDNLFFSEAFVFNPNGKNVYQQRRLYRYNLKTNVVTQAFEGWSAYAISKPYLTKDDRMCVSIDLPYQDSIKFDPVHKDTAETYCVKTSEMFASGVVRSSLESFGLPGNLGKLESTSFDMNARYVSGYQYSKRPSSWGVYEVDSQKPVKIFKATFKDRIALASNGETFAYADLKQGLLGDTIKGAVYSTKTGTEVSNFSIDIQKTPVRVLREEK